MEQKRLLWIIAATGVFLLVVLGAALIIYAPSARTPQTFASSTKNYNKDTANGWISLSPAPAETSDEKLNFENHFEQNNQPETEAETFAPNAKPEEVITETEVTAVPSTQQAQTIINNTTTIDLTALPQQIAQAPVPPKEITKAPASVLEERRPAPKKYEESKSGDYYEAVPKAQSKKQPEVAEKTVTKPVQQKAAVIVNNTTTVKAAPAKPMITQYWVQVTSLTSRKSADAAREVLARNQINADVFTYSDNKNQLFYRVRVGPYMTKTEAEYWRAKISNIDNFKNCASYVASTKSEKQ